MFVSTQYFQAGIALVDAILAALVAAVPAAILDITSKVHLYTAGPTPAFGSTIGLFTEADFDGYAAVVLSAVTGPINLPGGQGVFHSCNWLRTGVTMPNQSMLGYYLTDTGSTIYYGAEQFVTPVVMNIIGDALDLQLILAPKSVWGGQFQG